MWKNNQCDIFLKQYAFDKILMQKSNGISLKW